ncbi:hypothetical protein [Prochlorococcus sp. MIT 1300]|uniref:hypothetical protein n=1 Tax=Prochlorococcus sp. MIT 1300 TaxID=3096218 RepID=UPI002A749653|nr:hypothetical protein [Prochlorococcus sp. MIT 1300]
MFMVTQLIVLITSTLLLLFSLQPSWSTAIALEQDDNMNQLELPTTLNQDFLDDLPFEQRRQVLREELREGQRTSPTPQIAKRYNWLIR